MRNLNELIEKIEITNANADVASELVYQKILDEKKQKDDENLPHGIWDERKQLNWSEIESDCWNLITQKGFDIKILAIWLEALIQLQGMECVEFCFQAMLAVLKAEKYFFLNSDDQKLNYINYLDKNISKIIANINLNSNTVNAITLQQFEQFRLENFHQFQLNAAQISDQALHDLISIYDKIALAFEELKTFLNEMHCYNLQRTAKVLDQFHEVIRFTEELKLNGNVTEAENSEINVQTEHNMFYYKNEAFSRVEEAIEILERVDLQNFTIPILRKVLKWKDLSLIEIFEDIETPEQIASFISILKEK